MIVTLAKKNLNLIECGASMKKKVSFDCLFILKYNYSMKNTPIFLGRKKLSSDDGGERFFIQGSSLCACARLLENIFRRCELLEIGDWNIHHMKNLIQISHLNTHNSCLEEQKMSDDPHNIRLGEFLRTRFPLYPRKTKGKSKRGYCRLARAKRLVNCERNLLKIVKYLKLTTGSKMCLGLNAT